MVDDPTRRAARRDALIIDALTAAFDLLDSSPDSARVRELRAQARSYEQAIKQWAAFPPSDAQLDAMFDLVAELHAKAVAAKTGTRHVSRAGKP